MTAILTTFVAAFVGGIIGYCVAVRPLRRRLRELEGRVKGLMRDSRDSGLSGRVARHDSVLMDLVGMRSILEGRRGLDGLLRRLDEEYQRPARGLDKVISEAILRQRDGGENA